MPWTAKNDPELCSASEPWAVVKLDDGSVAGCHKTEGDAQKQVAALYAQEGGNPDEYGRSDPPRRAAMTDSNPAGITVNFNTFPSVTGTDIAGIWRTSTGTNYLNTTFGLTPGNLRSEDEPAGEETEEVEDGEEDPQGTDGGEVEDQGDSEDPPAGEEESGPEGTEEVEEAEAVESEEPEAELKDDPEEARSRVHSVPYAFRPVTRSVANDCRGLPDPVLERLADLKEDVGVVDRVGRGACELRFRPELRFNPDGTLFLHGYATVYDFPYDVAGGPPFGWSETIVRDACRVSVQQGADVRLLINHDGIPLARTKSGTLRLENDELGLYNVAPSLDPRSPTVQSLLSAMSRGDMDEMSFAFKVKEQEWNDDYTERHITEVMLFDVSVVTYPANPAATASTRRSDAPGEGAMPLAEAMLQLRQLQVRGDRLRGTR